MIRKQSIPTSGRAVDTMRLMRQVTERYHKDMAPFAHYSFPEIYDYIKAIPFRPDPPGRETIMRPLHTINRRGAGGDCDDKSIALAAWARLHRIPYRFVAVRLPRAKMLHHVFPELYIAGRWVAADPTYAFNHLDRQRRYAERVYG